MTMKILLSLLLAIAPVNSFGVISDLDKADVAANNFMPNAGFESGKASWSATGGSLSVVTSGSNLGFGKSSLCWDSSASGQKLQMSLTAIPIGVYGKNGQANMSIITPSGTATHLMRVTDGTNNITASDLSVTSSTSYKEHKLGFIFPSSGSIRLELESVASNEPQICLDMGYLGVNRDLLNLGDNARYMGSVNYVGVASCVWSTASNTFVPLSANASCNTATVTGELIAPATKILGFQINKKIGTYLIIPRLYIDNFNTGAFSVVKMSDGTDESKEQPSRNRDSATGDYLPIGSMVFTSTTVGLATIQMYGKTNTGTMQITATATNSIFGFDVYYYPTSQSQAVKADQTNYGWTAYTPTFNGFGTPTSVECFHKRDGEDVLIDCKFSPSTTSAVEARVGLPSGLTISSSTRVPSIRAVGAWFKGGGADDNHGGNILISAGQTYVKFSGNYTFASATTTVDSLAAATDTNVAGSGRQVSLFARVPISGWSDNQKAPQLVNSLITSYSGVAKSIYADINCDSSSAITSQSGTTSDGIASVGNISSTSCALTISTGFFSSSPWSCMVTPKTALATVPSCSCASATSCTITGVVTSYDAYVGIVGPR